MNALLLMTSLLIGTHQPEDFHYYDMNLQPRGLPVVNKLYVQVPEDNKKDFFEHVERLSVDRFKIFNNGELNGVLLFFKNKKDTLEALNGLSSDKRYLVSPVVVFDGIEVTHTNEIAVQAQPSVNEADFTKRLSSIADGKFTVSQIKGKLFSVRVKELNNPSNVLILANLLAKDSAWNAYAMVNWVPIDGYVKANLMVETAATGQLGEMRNLKLVVDVFNPNVKVRTDLLPQLGQGYTPFPFSGEVWFDPSPPKITEIKTNRGKTITISYAFRHLQYGNFTFQPMLVSYEKDGELKTVKTENCLYAIKSVIAGTDIDDIQARTGDGLMILPVGGSMPMPKDTRIYNYAKYGISVLCFSLAAMLFAGAVASAKRHVWSWMQPDGGERYWVGLRTLATIDAGSYYRGVSQYVNLILTESFGVSLYKVNMHCCGDTFKALAAELDKIYQPAPSYNVEKLKRLVTKFCKDRRL